MRRGSSAARQASAVIGEEGDRLGRNVTVTFGTVMLGGSDPGSFKIASDQCSGKALAKSN